jgi:hypothetical protein
MQDLRVSALTQEYLSEPVRAADPNVDLTAVPVWMAVKAQGVNPVNADWQTASWHVDADSGLTAARCKLGVDLPLTPGVMVAWIKLDLGDEIPVRDFARLLVI